MACSFTCCLACQRLFVFSVEQDSNAPAGGRGYVRSFHGHTLARGPSDALPFTLGDAPARRIDTERRKTLVYVVNMPSHQVCSSPMEGLGPSAVAVRWRAQGTQSSSIWRRCGSRGRAWATAVRPSAHEKGLNPNRELKAALAPSPNVSKGGAKLDGVGRALLLLAGLGVQISCLCQALTSCIKHSTGPHLTCPRRFVRCAVRGKHCQVAQPMLDPPLRQRQRRQAELHQLPQQLSGAPPKAALIAGPALSPLAGPSGPQTRMR